MQRSIIARSVASPRIVVAPVTQASSRAQAKRALAFLTVRESVVRKKAFVARGFWRGGRRRIAERELSRTELQVDDVLFTARHS